MTSAPNVVLIFTDNQQAATLGCYGNPETHTPHLDQMADAGTVFDNAFCPNGFCSPSRASVLTGLLPSQHGVHSWIDDRKSAEWPDDWHALAGERTLPQILQDRGYATALCGKYHLGQPTRPMPGFSHWVTMADGHVRSFYRNAMFDNGETYDHDGHTVDFFTAKGIAFMEEQVAKDRPFFLYLPYPAPYGHWPATKEPDRCRHSARYDDCPMDSVPRVPLSAEAVRGYDMKKSTSGGGLDLSMLMRAPNDLATLRSYYAQVSMVDDGVGQILAALDRLGVADDTLVVFTADHGMSLGHHGFWGHGAATFPSNLHHAAHSVPMILRGPGVASGQRRAQNVSNMDLFATILDAVGEAPPEDLPSRSLCPLLGQGPAQWGEDAVYSEQEETRVIRTGKWAYFQRFQGAPGFAMTDALFDVETDPDETRNLIDDPALQDVAADLKDALDHYFARHARPRADLWRGGVPLQNSVRGEVWKDAWGAEWKPVFSY